jgi:hypothetical protein
VKTGVTFEKQDTCQAVGQMKVGKRKSSRGTIEDKI